MIALLVTAMFELSSQPGVSSVAMNTKRDIDRACNSAAGYGDKNESSVRIVADVSEGVLPRKGEGKWKRFARTKDMEGVGEEGAPNTQIRVWRTPDGIAFVEAYYTSGSGDWAQFLDSCYRPDGTLARSTSIYNSFLTETEEGGVRRVRVRHYDSNGKIADTTRRVENIQTGKPAPKARFGDVEEPVALRLEDLPFWTLVGDGLTRR
jgi:hypothetical protein